MALKKNKIFSIEEVYPNTRNQARLKKILTLFQGKRVLVIGDVGLDRYTIGSVERISPEAPVPIVLVQEEKLKLGLAANVADNVQALGGFPSLVGVVGGDRCGEDFLQILEGMGIETLGMVEDGSRRTILKERIVSDRQQLLRIDYETPSKISRSIENQILEKVSKLLVVTDAVIIEDYAKGTLTENLMKAIFKMAKKAKKWVAVDPNLKTPVTQYRGVDILTPNTREAEYLSGISIRDDRSLRQAGEKILKATLAQHLVITRGRDGMAIFSRGESKITKIPTSAREVYDVSGAGDTVISVLILALIAGASIEEASMLGNLAAGVEVGKRGTATVSPAEIRSALELL